MNKDFGLYFWIHIILLVPAYLSPLLVHWEIIALAAVLLQISYWILGGCFVTHLELGKEKNKTFVWYYLHKLFPTLDPQKTRFVIRVIVPILLIGIAYILQVQLGLKPLIAI